MIESQIERWRHRLPDVLFGDQMDEVATAIELQEEFLALKAADRRRIEDIREVIASSEERVNILRGSRDDTWEVVSDRLTSEVDRVSATLTERMAEVERAVQTRSASPATTVEQNPTLHEDIARLDSRIEAGFQAFSREVDELRKNCLSPLMDKTRTTRSGLEASSFDVAITVHCATVVSHS